MDIEINLNELMAKAMGREPSKAVAPVLTDELRAIGFKEFSWSQWPDVGPDELCEIIFADGDYSINTLPRLNASKVVAYRPFSMDGWTQYTGGWPACAPDDEVQVFVGDGTMIVTRPAHFAPWGDSDEMKIKAWRVKPADFDTLFPFTVTAKPDEELSGAVKH